MRRHLNKLEIHRFTYRQTYRHTNKHLAMCTLTTFWTVQYHSVQDSQDSHQASQNNHQDILDNQNSHQVSQEMEFSKQEIELVLPLPGLW